MKKIGNPGELWHINRSGNIEKPFSGLAWKQGSDYVKGLIEGRYDEEKVALRTYSSKNPGAAYHRSRAANFESLSKATKGNQSKDFWMRKKDSDWDAEESEFLKMSNPKHKVVSAPMTKVSWLPIIIVAGLGYLWWKNRTIV